MAPPTFPQKCLAFHGPMLYEAKTIRIYDPETKTTYTKATADTITPATEGAPADLPLELQDKVAYFIHYKGWKSTWDEWVSDERVLGWNEENLRTQKELKQMALAAAKKKKSFINLDVDGPALVGAGLHSDTVLSTSAATLAAASASMKRRESGVNDDAPHSSGRTTKRGRGFELDLDKEDDFIRKQEVSLTVPDQLKALLVDDWEFITKEHQVVPLPRDITVADVLEAYQEAAPPRASGSAEADIFDEVISGIKLYFDRALGNILLYRFERQQYLNIKKKYPDFPMSQIYGSEHLLRLFVSFPALIAQTNMDQQSISVLREHLEDCLQYMLEHRGKLFVKEYENTSPHYEALSRGT